MFSNSLSKISISFSPVDDDDDDDDDAPNLMTLSRRELIGFVIERDTMTLMSIAVAITVPLIINRFTASAWVSAVASAVSILVTIPHSNPGM
ncbi:MAG: hypothetical protein MAG458_01478 [Nitrosopumilus sp.]|nr:hypothetical protein [Nitrosopumilus sp.]